MPLFPNMSHPSSCKSLVIFLPLILFNSKSLSIFQKQCI
jgi:hypothetical protein